MEENVKKLCEDFITLEPIQYPVMLFNRVYECKTLFTIWQTDNRCPITRQLFMFDDIKMAPPFVWEICSLVNDKERDKKDPKLKEVYAEYLLINGNFRLAAEMGNLRAMILNWVHSNGEDAEYKAANELVKVNECGHKFLGLSNMFRNRLNEAIDSFMVNWKSPLWSCKSETAFYIGVCYYWKHSNKTTWAKKALKLDVTNDRARLLLAQLYFRRSFEVKNNQQLWVLIFDILDKIDLRWVNCGLKNDTNFIKYVGMTLRRGKYKWVKNSKKMGMDNLKFLAENGHEPSKKVTNGDDIRTVQYGPIVHVVYPYMGI